MHERALAKHAQLAIDTLTAETAVVLVPVVVADFFGKRFLRALAFLTLVVVRGACAFLAGVAAAVTPTGSVAAAICAATFTTRWLGSVAIFAAATAAAIIAVTTAGLVAVAACAAAGTTRWLGSNMAAAAGACLASRRSLGIKTLATAAGAGCWVSRITATAAGTAAAPTVADVFVVFAAVRAPVGMAAIQQTDITLAAIVGSAAATKQRWCFKIVATTAGGAASGTNHRRCGRVIIVCGATAAAAASGVNHSTRAKRAAHARPVEPGSSGLCDVAT